MKTATVQAELTEPELIHRILSGERELYYNLVAPYERMVYVSALSLLRDETEAEDCAQEAFLKGFHHLAEFRGESKFGSWLVRITLNEAKMKIRKMRGDLFESVDQVAEGEEEFPSRSLVDWRAIPSEDLERKEIRGLIEKAIEKLPEKYRVVLMLRDIQGLDVATTAQLIGVNEPVVKTRLSRARFKMRELLAPVVTNSRVFSYPIFTKGKNPWL
jgi:RNA polymerase sigma-70 factor (ECF subfamily)